MTKPDPREAEEREFLFFSWSAFSPGLSADRSRERWVEILTTAGVTRAARSAKPSDARPLATAVPLMPVSNSTALKAPALSNLCAHLMIISLQLLSPVMTSEIRSTLAEPSYDGSGRIQHRSCASRLEMPIGYDDDAGGLWTQGSRSTWWVCGSRPGEKATQDEVKQVCPGI